MDTLNYVALSHQMALRRRLDVIANNIANVDTTGFKRESAVFESYLTEQKDADVRSAREVNFVIDQGTGRDMTVGDLLNTDNPMDFALLTEGYFSVQTEDGKTVYTRNGQFRRSDDGYLVTTSGDKVLTTGGPLELTAEDQNFAIAPDGTITTSTGTKGELAIVRFDDPGRLEKAGNSYLSGPGAIRLQPEDINVRTGMLEGSNVKPITEMVEMIDVLRSYQSTTRLIDRYEDIRKRSIERLGRVQ